MSKLNRKQIKNELCSKIVKQYAKRTQEYMNMSEEDRLTYNGILKKVKELGVTVNRFGFYGSMVKC